MNLTILNNKKICLTLVPFTLEIGMVKLLYKEALDFLFIPASKIASKFS